MNNKQTQEQAEFKLIVLQACKVKEPMGAYKGYYSTLFYKDGKQFAKIPAEQDQPRKGCKTYILNCFTYGIEWIDTPFDRTPSNKDTLCVEAQPKWKIGDYYPPIVIVEDTEDEYSVIEIGEVSQRNQKIANRIVTAVNNHDALVIALRELLSTTQSYLMADFKDMGEQHPAKLAQHKAKALLSNIDNK